MYDCFCHVEKLQNLINRFFFFKQNITNNCRQFDENPFHLSFTCEISLCKACQIYPPFSPGQAKTSRRSRTHAKSLQGLSCLTPTLMTDQDCFTLLG